MCSSSIRLVLLTCLRSASAATQLKYVINSSGEKKIGLKMDLRCDRLIPIKSYTQHHGQGTELSDHLAADDELCLIVLIEVVYKKRKRYGPEL